MIFDACQPSSQIGSLLRPERQRLERWAPLTDDLFYPHAHIRTHAHGCACCQTRETRREIVVRSL